MTERIILAPGASGSELLRTLAKHGVNTIGCRVVSSVELARIALMRSGITMTEEFLAKKEEPSVIFSFLSDIAYFKAPSFADAESLAKALTIARSLITSDEKAELSNKLCAGEFTDKNAAILEVYDKYMAKCDEDCRIDSIGLVRKAIGEADPLTKADFKVLKEYPLMPLERALIDAVSGGAFEETSLIDLCSKDPKALTDVSMTEGYGRINEVEDILTDIYRNEISLDQCVIACADPSSYSQVIYDLACRYDIPVTYGSGVPILDSGPARLLKLIYEWSTIGFFGIDALRKIINSDAFDRSEFEKTLGVDELKRRDAEELVKMAGSLRLSFDGATNRQRLYALKKTLNTEYRLKIYEWTEKIAAELEKGCTAFLSKYALIRTDASGRITETAGRIDQSAMRVITEALDSYLRYEPDGDINDMIPEILNKTVCSENSREGYLHVTSITGALSCIRSNLYVCGLGAAEFPGSPTENYLLLDSDLELLADEETAPTSGHRIKKNKKALDDLLSFAAALDTKIHLSYSGYSLSELKEQNPSSVLFNIYERIHPGSGMDDFKKSLKHAPYFAGGISADRLIGDEYSKGAEFIFEDRSGDKKDAASVLERAWSPSALSNYLQCPRHFYLANVLGIKVNEPDDPFMVLSAAVTGTLTHTMMQKLAAKNYSREDFFEASSREFDEALNARPPIHKSDADALKKDFMRMMETTYDMDPHNTVLSAEEEYTFRHPSGISLHGYPDRVERDAAGNYLVADFKTKRKIEHTEDDFSSCMQVIVYAWLCEQAGIDISSCEYRYLRKGKTITCKYDDEMRDMLSDFLEGLKTAIENNDFPRTPDKDISCKYCRFSDVCEWPEDEAGKEAGADE